MRSDETWVQSYETWAKRCEEARRTEDAAREAHETFPKNFVKLMNRKNNSEEYCVTVADTRWQASQSYHLRGLNLGNVDNIRSKIWGHSTNGHEASASGCSLDFWRVIELECVPPLCFPSPKQCHFLVYMCKSSPSILSFFASLPLVDQEN